MFLKHHPNTLTFSCRLKLKRFLLPTTNSWCRLSGKPGDSTAEILHVTSAPLFSATPSGSGIPCAKLKAFSLKIVTLPFSESSLRTQSGRSVFHAQSVGNGRHKTKPFFTTQHLVGKVCS